jgi:hypothetical protein
VNRIKKLPPEIYQGRKVYYGLYECSLCGSHVKRTYSTGAGSKTCGCHPYKGEALNEVDTRLKKKQELRQELNKDIYIPLGER